MSIVCVAHYGYYLWQGRAALFSQLSCPSKNTLGHLGFCDGPLAAYLVHLAGPLRRTMLAPEGVACMADLILTF